MLAKPAWSMIESFAESKCELKCESRTVARLKIKLTRNLRRSIMRGHPWVYREAIAAPGSIDRAQLVQVLDAKGELGWAIYDPHGPLSLRILSTDKAPPTQGLFEARFQRALQIRQGLFNKSITKSVANSIANSNSDELTATNAFRLFNGEGDRLPGMVCDIYDTVAVLQFDGQGPNEYWDAEMAAAWLLKNTDCKAVVEKTRRNTERTTNLISGSQINSEIEILENHVRFLVNLEKGQKTGFFLDQRENRNFIRQISANKSVLNLFSYTGGFSVYAGLGGARKVASLDVSKGAIAMAEENWRLNGLAKNQHVGLCVDVFEYLKGDSEMWDHIIVDPPSMSHSESQRELAKTKYVELFSAAAQRVSKSGELSLSSCSSHVTFEDFFDIIDEALSSARRTGQIIRVSGQGPDHPFPHTCRELRYLKFVHLSLD